MSLNQLIREARSAWHGVKLSQPDWSPFSRSVACTVEIAKEKLLFHLILNAYWDALDFELPPLANVGGSPWRRWIDTALDSPNDIVEWQNSPSIAGSVYRAEPCSVSVFFAGTEGRGSAVD